MNQGVLSYLSIAKMVEGGGLQLRYSLVRIQLDSPFKKKGWFAVAFWNKKKKVPKVYCSHAWQDFPWYIEARYDYKNAILNIDVIEPYVCIHCKERKDEVLDSFERRDVITQSQALAIKQAFEQRFAQYTAPRCIIEDKILDMQLVDKDYLERVARLVKIAESQKLEIKKT